MNLASHAVSAVTGMVWIPGGVFTTGSDHHNPEKKPAHEVRVDGFWIDSDAVTNAQFARFVHASGHVTLAEKPADPADYPGADPALLVPSSVVLVRPPARVDLRNRYNWWQYIAGADWRHPRGPGSSIDGMDGYPVVHVAYEDAAHASWAGNDLPTEAEWEFASKGGGDGTEFAGDDELVPEGRFMTNTWQGEFPWDNQELAGFEFTAPVGWFQANGYGLHDMIGNVWELTCDWYQDRGRIQSSCCTLHSPRGGEEAASIDERNPQVRIPRWVTKGGSHACAQLLPALPACRAHGPAGGYLDQPCRLPLRPWRVTGVEPC